MPFGVQPDWTIYLEPNQSPSKHNPEAVLAKLQYQDSEGQSQTIILGGVAAYSIEEHQLRQRVGATGCLSLTSPIIQLQPPRAITKDIEAQLVDAATGLRQQVTAIPDEERLAYASALWHSAGGMGIVLREFTPELATSLQTIPPMTLRGLGRSTNEVGALPDGEYQVRFTQLEYQSDRGEEKTVPAIAIVSEEGEQTYGSISNESVSLPPGTLARAQIEVATDGKTAQMQVLEKLEASAQAAVRLGAVTVDRMDSSARGEQPKLARQEPLSDRYLITAGELRQLYKAAQVIAGQSDLEIDLPKVAALGAKLKAQYNQEHSADGNQKPPDEYRHPSVTLSAAGRQKMEVAIAQATALQAERQQRSQLEH